MNTGHVAGLLCVLYTSSHNVMTLIKLCNNITTPISCVVLCVQTPHTVVLCVQTPHTVVCSDCFLFMVILVGFVDSYY